MDHKEKAIDLVNQFRMVLMDEDTECGNEILCTLIGIKFANIVADTVIDELEGCNIINPFHEYAVYETIQDWKKLKKELAEL